MNSENFNYTDSTGKQIYAYKWFDKNQSSPKAIIQIAHGMAEHSARYERFAEALVKESFIVYANDHRGHGKTAGSIENTGHFSNNNGWNLVIEDMHELTNIIKKEYPNTPLILFGHSMGSLLSRSYIMKYADELQGLILSGTNFYPNFLTSLGNCITGIQRFFMGKNHKSKLLDQLSFGSFNKKFKPNRTAFDWLSRDPKKVDKYVADDYCGFLCSTQFFKDLFYGLKQIHNPVAFNQIPIALPLLIFSGECDPVGGFTKGVNLFYKKLSEAGKQNIVLKFYQNGRHEMLNEINREEVFNDVVKWLKENIKKS
jgi:alpha-beta hydrolase superfamily lysophospholipase